ncbi:Probable Xaa-Pro aminopeptidase P (AMPP) (Aminopeptidase P) (Aminoacylproline aminopeptidase) (Prolidase) [Durusdinium trenchii]|uniref:Probable Xaa-Pro aminopeptidase P (AMPP) (Aminopeptidase P) (Aminoacylproline aminopeptidase) (Prolidase) n=1 Tax=Durusdinium trenchii TaxID=1381693 RepID=A0ABP0LS90_9DINO
MFQTFEPVSDRSFAGKHLPLLRAEMKKQNLDGFIIPHDDEYQNEYIPEYAERLMWATGFSGSAGAAIIMSERAVMLTDGRYTLQVRQQADADYFDYVDISETSPDAWLSENAPKGARIGYDPMLHTMTSVKRLKAAAEKTGFHLVAVSGNPVDAAWKDQPAAPLTPVQPHDRAYAGKSSDDKRKEIAKAIADAGADTALITAPPSLAWLFNIRGQDVSRSPLPLGRALIGKDGAATLFLAPEKTGNELPGHLGDQVDLRAESDVESALEKLGRTGARVAVDPALAPSKYVDDLKEAGAEIIELTDPCALPRATKNDTEIEGARTAHIRDGGQYPDGTTDITRTVPIGQASDEMRDRFTRVLKGHIALATMKFPAGTTGHQLDAMARKPLWDAGLDYDHGTGHGVGSFLGVHEGPQRIAKAPNDQALKPGMILSNEPGFYKAGEFGIRIENLIVVTEPKPVPGGEREMMEFETITLAPINLDLVQADLLTEQERQWLNEYHARVRETLTSQIPDDLKDWFETATRAI